MVAIAGNHDSITAVASRYLQFWALAAATPGSGSRNSGDRYFELSPISSRLPTRRAPEQHVSGVRPTRAEARRRTRMTNR